MLVEEFGGASYKKSANEGDYRTRKQKNLPLSTYSALADFLQRGKVVTKGRVCVTKSNTLEDSEGNGRNHKKTGRFFDEKML